MMQETPIVMGHKKSIGWSLNHPIAGLLFCSEDELTIRYIKLYLTRDIHRESWDPKIYKEIKKLSRGIYLSNIGKIHEYPIQPDDLTILEELDYIKFYGMLKQKPWNPNKLFK